MKLGEGVSHEVVLVVTPAMRQSVRDKLARRKTRLLGEALMGTECGEHDLGEIENSETDPTTCRWAQLHYYPILVGKKSREISERK